MSKSYKIHHEGATYLTLRDILTENFSHPLKFLKRKAKEVAGLDKEETFWALKDLNFSVEKGQTLGIIGANGSGKSTLLKILSQITPPTEGEARIRGKMTSLLEVGTGFHPELTGRENILLNGAIMGMSKKEVERKFDQIVEFAGIDKFLDTQVKYYSSGMYVRLAFSVAAHMEPDILVIDEVLAVGDAEFQKKCLGKMEEVTKEAGRTILFVSHNMSAIEQLCSKCILLEKGQIKMIGETKKVVDFYLSAQKEDMTPEIIYVPNKEKDAQITKVSILNIEKKLSAHIPNDEELFFEIEYEVYTPIKKALLCAFFFQSQDKNLYLISTETDNKKSLNESLRDFEIGKYKTTIKIPSFIFTPNIYHCDISIQRPFQSYYADNKQDIYFEITPVYKPKSINHENRVKVKVSPILNYVTNKLE
jgi:lipopolysaccharide transport system ATP-binding protein